MTALDDITAGQKGIAGVVSRLSERFRPVTRRGVLVGAAVAGSALATKPREYALRPVAAYATICGPGNTASSGWTVFCCTINKGVNGCPPGSFTAGWWKAADSSWCGGGYRYIVDCNAKCTKCTSGCSDHICDSRCWNCSCGTGSTATCDQRRVCCNAFRYGQCNTHVSCSGGVHCRVVSCVPPYRWDNCTTTSLQDDRTSEHSAPCVPTWSAIQQKYDALGGHGSFLKASTGPQRSIGDGRGQYVTYQAGVIYWSSTTGARALTSWVRSQHDLLGGCRGGALGYPTSDRVSGLRDSGWIQYFERGAITDSASTSTQAVWGMRWYVWNQNGRQDGLLGYPVGAYTETKNGWIQLFQKGAIVDSSSTSTQVVAGSPYTIWVDSGRETGVLGYPVGARTTAANGGWIQPFQKGAICDSWETTTQTVWGVRWVMWQQEGREKGRLGYPTAAVVSPSAGTWIQTFQHGAIVASGQTPACVVAGRMYTAWQAAGRENGVLKYPNAPEGSDARGSHQVFQGGELWALGSGAARRVYGDVLTQWQEAGGAAGRYGYPITDTVADGNRLTCTFENGTITA